MPSPAGYSRLQIRLHWIVAILIAFQYLAHEGMEKAWEVVEKGGPAVSSTGAMAHIAAGILVVLLVIWRLFVRMRRGAPDFPAEENAMQKLAAKLVHGLLYLLLLLIPASGIAAWFGSVKPAGEAHGFLTGALLLVVAVHFLAAIYHHFILKTDVMRRMLKPES